MTVTIGQMRSTVRFEKNMPVDTTSGGQTEVYSELLTTKGYLRSRPGTRYLNAGELMIFSSHELICRFQDDFVIDSSVRAVIDDRIFTISGWELIDEKKYYYRFQLNEAKQ